MSGEADDAPGHHRDAATKTQRAVEGVIEECVRRLRGLDQRAIILFHVEVDDADAGGVARFTWTNVSPKGHQKLFDAVSSGLVTAEPSGGEPPASTTSH